MAGRKRDIDDILEAAEPSAPDVPVPPLPPEPPEVPKARSGRWKLWVSLIAIGGAAYAGWQAPTWLGIAPDTAALEARLAELETRAKDTAGELGGLEVRIADLEGKPAGVTPADLAAVQDGLTASGAARAAQDQAVEALAQRLSALERATTAAPDGTVPDAALAGLQVQIDELRSSGEGTLSALDDLAARLTALEELPVADAAPVGVTVLAEIAAAIETGQPFAAALLALREARPDAEGLETLAVHANGVLTLTALQAGFPDAARAALSDARAAETAAGETSSRLGAFFRDQLGMRSLSPQDGSDADAVLSRAEAALMSGNLSGALDELATLPESAAPAMADWLAVAQARVDVLNALAALQGG